MSYRVLRFLHHGSHRITNGLYYLVRKHTAITFQSSLSGIKRLLPRTNGVMFRFEYLVPLSKPLFTSLQPFLLALEDRFPPE
jgi:hypothetical protein